MAQEFPTLYVDRADGVVTVTLNRPEKKNALSGQMVTDLLAALREVEHTQTDRVVVLTGAGGDFCSGADLTAPAAPDEHPLERMRRVGAAALALHQLGKPTIAKVRGVAVGAGCNMALGCDLVAAAEEARFSEFFVRRGLSVDFGGTWLLPRLVGLHKAKELALIGDILSAKEAGELGLLNRVVADGDLDALVDDWAQRLASGPPVALSQTKRLLNDAFESSMAQALEDEGRAQVVNLATEDTVEAFEAFAQKRDPVFTGRSRIE